MSLITLLYDLYWEWHLIPKITFEKHLRPVSRAASQRLGILRKSWQVSIPWLIASWEMLSGFCPVRFGVLFCCWYTPVIHIGTLMRLLAAKPSSTAGLLFLCQHLCGTILVTMYSMVWNWRVSRAGPMLFYWPSCSLPFVSCCFPFLFFHSMDWYCEAGVFGLIGC